MITKKSPSLPPTATPTGEAAFRLTTNALPSIPEVVVIDGIIRRSGIWPSRWLHSTAMDITDDIIDQRAKIFRVCGEVPGIIAAGGCVSCVMDFSEKQNEPLDPNNVASDLDLYVRATDPNAAMHTVERLVEWMKPHGTVTMSRMAMTFRVGYANIKRILTQDGMLRGYRGNDGGYHCLVQVILRMLPDTGDICADIASLLGSYDMSCCRFATDGSHVYTTADAVRTMYGTRISRMGWSRLTDVHRLVKYHRRGFDFAIAGPDGGNMQIHPDSDGMRDVSADMESSIVMPADIPYCDVMQDDGELHDQIADDNYRTMSIVHERDINVLSLSFDAFMRGCDDFRVGVVCGDASTFMRDVAITGMYSEEYLLDWKCLTMNDFCDNLQSGGPMPGTECGSRMLAFADILNRFERAIRQSPRIPPPFGGGCSTMSTVNSDIVRFSQRWCMPHQEHLDGTGENSPKRRRITGRSRMLNPIPWMIANCPSDLSDTPFDIVHCSYMEIERLRIMIPMFRNRCGFSFMVEINTPTMDMVGGLPIVGPPLQMKFLTLPCTMPYHRSLQFDTFMMNLRKECMRAVNEYGGRNDAIPVKLSNIDANGEIIIKYRAYDVQDKRVIIAVEDASGALVPYDPSVGYYASEHVRCTVNAQLCLRRLVLKKIIMDGVPCLTTMSLRWQLIHAIIRKTGQI